MTLNGVISIVISFAKNVANLAIVNALQLEAARRRASRYPRLNYDAHTKVVVGQPIRCCITAFLLLIRYVRCNFDF